MPKLMYSLFSIPFPAATAAPANAEISRIPSVQYPIASAGMVSAEISAAQIAAPTNITAMLTIVPTIRIPALEFVPCFLFVTFAITLSPFGTSYSLAAQKRTGTDRAVCPGSRKFN